jgi:dihydroxyacetone kinase-like predicted kinase
VRVTPLSPPSGAQPARPSVGVVAVAPGAGLAQLLATSGALVLVREQLRPPTAQELLHAVRDACAEAVVLLPDGPDAAEAAETAVVSAREQGLRVEVLPTQAPCQALAALAVHDPGGPLPDVLERMADAAAATRHGAVTLGSGEEQPPDNPADSHLALGLVDGCVVTSGDDAAAVARTVVDRLLCEGGELLTVLTGAAPEARTLAAGLCRHVRDTASDVDVQLLDGGQDGALLLLGVE